MILADVLSNARLIYIDTSPVIYFLERNPVYVERMREVFHTADTGVLTIVSSTLTLMETLVKPSRSGDHTLYALYRDWFMTTEHMRIVPVTETVAERGAAIRATYNLKPPDALHIATAIEEQCDLFLTNDQEFKRVKEIPVIFVSDLQLS